MKILLVAKPWKGGLGRYYFLSLQRMFPGQVEWISTRPQGLADTILFRRDPQAWWAGILKKIETSACNAALFIGWRKEFRALNPNANSILYIVDAMQLKPGDADAFGRVFLSDPGYEAELLEAMPPEKYGGAVPFAHYPPLHHPVLFKGKKQDLCFIGNRDAARDSCLEQLFMRGFHPLIVGNYFGKGTLFWKHPLSFRPAVGNDAMGRIYARHKMTINIHARVVRQGTNMRTFECAGYGIPQIVEYRPGLDSYFTPEKEILVFRNADEMEAQIRALLGNPERVSLMAEAARKRALAEHTYEHRIVSMLRHVLPDSDFDRFPGRKAV